MASKALKGLTIKIGGDTSELTKSLDKVDKQSRSLSGELGQINKLLKLDPKNTELLAQKQKVLAEAIGNTEKKLDTLREAEKQVQAQFERGEVSEAQYRALQREIIETEAKLGRYKSAAQETADAVEELGKEAGRAADQLDEQADATEDAGRATEDFDDAAGDLAAGGLAALAAAAAAAVTAIVALAEESREYRAEMGKLETAFDAAGHGAETATKTYETLQSVIGETDQSVEAAQQIALLAESEKDAAEWAELAAGVIGRFGDALQPETFFEAANETIKLGEATGAYTQLLEGCGESVEDFNEGLAECSTESEKQEYMLSITKKLLGSAATQYKKTNKEVIRANEATEKWNKATAKIGKTVEPVVTDIKEMGVALMEDAAEPLKDIAKYIQKQVLPAITKAGKWVKSNGPTIKSALIGITAAVVAFKVATIATTVAQNGLKGAILATTVAQKALALAQAATPWGLIATAVAGVTVAVLAYAKATENAKKPVDALTKEERELMAAADEAAEAFRDQKKATEESLGGITSQMGHVSNLAEELQSLASASGNVKEEDRERAQFILNELNEALGTEYTMTDGLIQKYNELKMSIDDVIQSKLANSLIEAANADYVSAIQNEAAALENLNLKEQDYQQQLAITTDAEAKYNELYKEWSEDAKFYNLQMQQELQNRLLKAKQTYEEESGILTQKKSDYDQAAQDYSSYYNTIANYEEAQAAALSGNYQRAVDILARKGGAYGTYSDKVDKETAKVLDTLYKEAIDAGLEAERTKANFEKGVDGYTKEMVTEAEKGYNEAMDEFANAYADAESVGEDLAGGMTDGAENKRSGLLAKARSLVSGFLKAARDEADSHSPSRKAIKIFEDIGDGAEIGVENKTEDVARAGAEQAAALLDAYRTQEINAQRSLRNIAEQQTARQAAGQLTAATANSGTLDQILAAIKEGQVLLLDGEAVVGGTAKKMDSQLGMLRVLAARGAR